MATDLFRSERLVYRKVQPPKEGKEGASAIPDDPFTHFFTELAWDPSRINASPYLWDGPGTDFPEQLRGFTTNGMLLSMYICLPKTVAESGSGSGNKNPSSATSTSTSEQPSSPSASTAAADSLTPIGVVHLKGNPPGLTQHRTATIALVMLSGYQGRGYGGEAIRWATDWGFRVAGMHRMVIEATGWNVGAARLYERLGFVREGVRRKAWWFMGAWRDHVEFGMLEEEFWQLDWVQRKDVSKGEVAKLLGCA